MAAIDQYKHELLDFFHCPSDFDLIFGNPIKKIAVYQLLESIPKNEKSFDGEVGDVLVGGGSGESQTLRISTKGIRFILDENFNDFELREGLIKAFWTPTFSFKIGNGLQKLGWNPNESMEFWLA
ncbi:hypothetical protein [Chondrinema litorale]|uniref:hypothetical protein n=1 Tax=Chondrinema litorale TaxID=2994555 RepID=UPI0025435565|nr:hypothetical protein [Chondrinema litorale]UZR98557.1 hypothetical protein OQ292_31635 [Chondrinema litorale]